MSKRKSLSKKLRFEIFKRDLFTCSYCGTKPPGTVLEIDHIIPVVAGGDNDKNNLVTSCFDCNRGKGIISLKTVPNPISENIELLKEKELQIKEMSKFLSSIKRRETKSINKIAKIYSENHPAYELTKKFKNMSVRKFIRLLPINEVEEAMEKSTSYIDDPNDSLKYFCGICWNKIKGTSKYEH